MTLKTGELLSRARIELSGARDLDSASRILVEHLHRPLSCDNVTIQLTGDSNSNIEHQFSSRSARVFSLVNGQCKLGQQRFELPLITSDLVANLSAPVMVEVPKSIAVLPLMQDEVLKGAVEIHFLSNFHRWSREEISFAQSLIEMWLLTVAKIGSSPQIAPAAPQTRSAEDLAGLFKWGDLLVVRTDPDFRIVEIHGNTDGLLGVAHQELLNNRAVWSRFINPQDLRNLAYEITRVKTAPREFSAELRLKNVQDRSIRWLLLRVRPRTAANGELTGWEGLGVDITEKRHAENAVLRERLRLEALYDVASSLEVSADPSHVMLTGLRALVSATKSNGGICCVFDREGGQLELSAALGLGEEHLAALESAVGPTSLAYQVFASAEPLFPVDVQNETAPDIQLAREHGFNSVVAAPLMLDSVPFGVLVLFSTRPARYGRSDFELVRAAAQHISFAARRAETQEAERKQATVLATLYRITHELSRLFTTQEIAEHAVSIVQEELGFKRIWLGVINEKGTHISGRAGSGPGIRSNVIGVQIELDLRHDFFDEAVRTQQIVIVRADDTMNCSGLNRIIQKLAMPIFAIVPLVALGQTVGVIVVEPLLPSERLLERQLELLRSIAGEIGAVLLARRFESKVADADKMRMAGLLAAGVAHNFNNILQTITGQASLVEMQSAGNPDAQKAARTIVDVVDRGASLIRQLLSFTNTGSATRKTLRVNELLRDSEELYRSITGRGIELSFDLQQEIGPVLGDYSQLQQILTNLIVNAREAIGDRSGKIRVVTRQLRLSSGEIDPELPPGVYLRVDVIDDGVGMDSERQARCFEPFFTTKSHDSATGVGFSGSGLGLSSAFSYAKQHGGLITVESEIDRGSTFSVFLPIQQQLVVGPQDSQPESILQNRAVFIWQDSESFFPLSYSLHGLGFAVENFKGEKQLLHHLAQEAKELQVVVLDRASLNGSLLEVVRSIKKARRSTPVIVVVGDDHEPLDELLAISGVAIVRKPVDPRAFARTVRDAIGADRAAPLQSKIEKVQVNGVTGQSWSTDEGRDRERITKS